MNQKAAKRRRHWARQMSIGKPAIVYVGHQKKSKHNYLYVDIRLAPACTRGIYQRLKREQRKLA